MRIPSSLLVALNLTATAPGLVQAQAADERLLPPAGSSFEVYIPLLERDAPSPSFWPAGAAEPATSAPMPADAADAHHGHAMHGGGRQP